MKKIITIMLALILSVSMSMFFVACGEDEAEHVHTYATEWTSDETHHWKKPTCTDTQEVAEKAEHTWGADDKCSVCGKEKSATTPGDTTPGDTTPAVSLSERLAEFNDKIEANPTKFKLTMSVKCDMTAMGYGVLIMNESETVSENKLISSSNTTDAEGNVQYEDSRYYINGVSFSFSNSTDVWLATRYAEEYTNLNLEDKVNKYLVAYDITSYGVTELIENATVSGETATVTLKTGVTAPITVADGVLKVSGISVDMTNVDEDFVGLMGTATLEIKELDTATADIPADLNTYYQSMEEFIPLMQLSDKLYNDNTAKVTVKEVRDDHVPFEYDLLINDGKAVNEHPNEPYVIEEIKEGKYARFGTDGTFMRTDNRFNANQIFYDYRISVSASLYTVDYATGLYSYSMFVKDAGADNRYVLNPNYQQLDNSITGFSIELLADGKVRAIVYMSSGYTDTYGITRLEFVFDFSATPTVNIPTAISTNNFIDDEYYLYGIGDANDVRLLYVFPEESNEPGPLPARHVVVKDSVTFNGTTYAVTGLHQELGNVEYLYVPTSVTDFGGIIANYSGAFYYMGDFGQIKLAQNNGFIVYENGPDTYQLASNVYVYSESEPTPQAGVNYWHWTQGNTRGEPWA